MAWALQFDGVNDYLGGGLAAAMSGDFTLKYTGQVTGLPAGTFGNILVIYDGTNDYIGIAVQKSGSLLKPKIISNGKSSGLGNTTILESTDYTLEVRYVQSTNTASFYIDNVFEYSVNPTNGTTWIPNCVDYRFGLSITTSTSFAALLLKDGCEIIDSLTPANSLSWSATSSSHAPGVPVLDETTTNNLDGTGVNMPTDGSVWVNLGGGGTTIQESISFNAVSQHAISNNAIMSASITAGSISTVNNQTQITLSASIVATTSANFSLSTNATLTGTLEINSSPAVLMQNIVQAQANLLINSNAGFILSLGNAIQESLSFNSVAGDSANINVTFAGELFINSVSAVDLINKANIQGQLNIGSASAMSLVTSAIMSAGLDFSSISNVELTPGGIIVDITTPDSRTLRIAISDREYKIVATNRETTVTSNNRTFDVPQK